MTMLQAVMLRILFNTLRSLPLYEEVNTAIDMDIQPTEALEE